MSILFLAGLLAGCATAISKDLSHRARASGLTFVSVFEKPSEAKGKTVILGGYILDTQNRADGTTRLLILDTPLNPELRPKSADLSRGRFLIVTDRFLDPEVFGKGRLVTVGGTVDGSVVESIGDRRLTHPVIRAEEIYLWPIPRPMAYESYPFYDPFYPWGRPHPFHRFPGDPFDPFWP